MSGHGIPLYREIANRDFQIPDQANIGLVFEKYFGTSKDKKHTELEKFEKKKFNIELINELAERQRNLVEHQGGRLLFLKNENARFVTGMGRMHFVENGFAFHPLSGTPYLPGSSLKGAVRAWTRIVEEENAQNISTEIFGSSIDGVGNYVFLDLLPIIPPKLVVEIMTPHYSDYYQGEDAPGDWQDPNPIPFLAVEKGCEWQLAVLPRNATAAYEENMEQVFQLVKDSLSILGVGAKTAVGYGRFEEDTSQFEFYYRKKEKRRQALEDAKAMEASIAEASPEMRVLIQLVETENWLESKKYFSFIPVYLTKYPEPSLECIEWIRDNCIMEDDKGKKLWNNPRATKKKGLKHKLNQIEVVEALKKLLQS